MILILIACADPTKTLPDFRAVTKIVSVDVEVGYRLFVIFTNPSTTTEAKSIPAVRLIGTPFPVSSRSALDASESFQPTEAEPGIIDLRLWETDSIKLPGMKPDPAPRYGGPPPAASLYSASSFSVAPSDKPCKGKKGTNLFYGIPGDPPEICAEMRHKRTHGGITLAIYVDIKDEKVTDRMLEVMGREFLQEGPGNDIYDWVTDIYGEPWGDKVEGIPSSEYYLNPSFKNHISILLYDIKGDDVPPRGKSRTVGYFSWINNLKSSYRYHGRRSNGRLMFAMDSALFAHKDKDKDWEKSTWPQSVLSTLAHEFQHMIHYYQKSTANNNLSTSSQTWLNEMASEFTQDIIADKMVVPGPRGIVVDASFGDYADYTPDKGYSEETPLKSGRIRHYNMRMDTSLTAWDRTGRTKLYNYGAVYTFGAYLARNYGGAKLFRNIVRNRYTDERAVLEAIEETTGESKTFEELLIEWAKAALSSNKPAASKTYNFLSWPQQYFGIKSRAKDNSIEYRLGSINLYKYLTRENRSGKKDLGPLVYVKSPSKNPGPSSNTIFLVGESPRSGTYQLQLTIPAGMTATPHVVKKKQ